MSQELTARQIREQATRAVWSTVIGIINIIFGAVEVVRYIFCGALDPWFLNRPFYPGLNAPPGYDGQVVALSQHLPCMILGNLFAAALAVLLIVAGAGLIRRRRWAVKACHAWALLKIAHALAAAVVLHRVILSQIDAIPNTPTASLPFTAGGYGEVSLAYIGLVVALVWRVAYPVFVHEWLSRRKVKTEIAAWGKEGFCPTCGYDLRGAPSGGGGCPECGWNRQPEAAMTESIAPRSPAARG